MTMTYWQTMLEITPEVKAQGIKQCVKYPHSEEGYQYLLNYVTATTIRSWLITELGGNPVVSSSSSWQFVNGIGIELRGIRYIVIPDENIDRTFFNIPREWLEIPGWAGDFYLGATVDLENNEIELWGFTEFNTIKSATVDYQDQNYQLAKEHLDANLNLLLTQRHFNIPVQTRLISPIKNLTPERIKFLTDRLALASVIAPRLTLPFADWLSLLHNYKTLEQLSQIRGNGTPKNRINLRDWLANIFPTEWQEPTFAYALRGEEGKISRVRRLILTEREMQFEFYLVLSLIKVTTDRVSILFQLFPLELETLPELQIQIIDGEGNLIQQSTTNGTESMLKLRRFTGNIEDEFVLKLQYQNQEFMEAFII